MNFDMDKKFIAYIKNIKQVFLYVIDDCNLQCRHCLYKPNNIFYLNKKSIDLDIAIKLIEDFYEIGARKLTIMGGEPTLYGKECDWIPLLSLIQKAKEVGYQYVRIDTNGTFNGALLDYDQFKMLDEITFSLDGPNSEINDILRGDGVFNKCVGNIKRAIQLGYNSNITCCIHKYLVDRAKDGLTYLDHMIHFAEELGVQRINFHDLFKSGIPRDVWTDKLDISINTWFQLWSEIQNKIDSGVYKIPVRVPQGFISKERFHAAPHYYGYCSAKLGERVLIHPDGIIRVCSLMIGTPYGIAKYYDNKIVWDEGYTNELGDQDIGVFTPCAHQSKRKDWSPFVPLCVSFKPKQDEFVWNLIAWEQQNK